MTTDRTLLSMASPAIAVAGDMLIAVIFIPLLVTPPTCFFAAPTRWIERRMWQLAFWSRCAPARFVGSVASHGVVLAVEPGAWYPDEGGQLLGSDSALPVTSTRASRGGHHRGDGAAGGMSWYFDTENWASGMWNSWAASRTDAGARRWLPPCCRRRGSATTDDILGGAARHRQRRFFLHRHR